MTTKRETRPATIEATDTDAWVEHDLTRYRWNLSDGDRELIGLCADYQVLPDGKGGEYPAIIVYTTAPTTAKGDDGKIVEVPAGKFVVLSMSDGLRPVWGTMVTMAQNPQFVYKIAIKRSHQSKTAAGFQVNKVLFKHTTNGTPREALPPIPQYGSIADTSFSPQQLENGQGPQALFPST